ncbi:hypothetical protein GGX14DRAFT_540259, partial [Mycena pura]
MHATDWERDHFRRSGGRFRRSGGALLSLAYLEASCHIPMATFAQLKRGMGIGITKEAPSIISRNDKTFAQVDHVQLLSRLQVPYQKASQPAALSWARTQHRVRHRPADPAVSTSPP